MSNVLACYQLLEFNVISAQDLAPAGRFMRTYAVAWIDPDRKFSTKVDTDNGTNPTWNEKFVFRVDGDFLYDDESVITIDIYVLHWYRDIHVGTAQVLSSDLFPPSSQRNAYKSTGLQFMGLQVQRPSGHLKGIVNIGAAIIESSMRSMPIYDHNQPIHHAQPKPNVRRTKSDSSSMLGSEAVASEHKPKAKHGKAFSQVTLSEASTKSKKRAGSTLSGLDMKTTPKKGKMSKKTKVKSYDSSNNFHERVNVDYQTKSTPRREFQNYAATPLHAYAMTNAALEYGTPYRSNLGHRRPMMTNSELGPSASEVAEAIARQPLEEEEDSTVEGWSLDDTEEEMPSLYDSGERSKLTAPSKKGKRSRSGKTQGGNGLFSCFSVICGVECSIVCGGGGGKKSRLRQVHKSMDNESFL